MRFLTLVLIAIAFSGCITKVNRIEPCGPDNFLSLPAGAKIGNVPLPTDEQKNYTVVTQKAGVWASLDCWNRLEKGK